MEQEVLSQHKKSPSKHYLDEIKNDYRTSRVYHKVLLTPDIAKELWKLNTKNRKFRKNTALNYANAMRRGEWRFAGQSIVISKTGRLLDGQHRIFAVMSSGFPQYFNIEVGVDDEAFSIIDQGKVRSAVDAAYMDGVSENTAMILAAVKNIYAYRNLLETKHMNVVKSMKLSNPQAMELLENLGRDKMHQYSKISSRWYSKLRAIPAASYLFLLYIFAEKDEQQAIQFLQLLASGDGIGTGKDQFPVIYDLRQRFIRDAKQGTKYSDIRIKWGLIIRAWNNFRAGKTTPVRFDLDMDFPEAI
jgi:hypothetical protein